MTFFISLLLFLPASVNASLSTSFQTASQERERGIALYRQGKAAEAVEVLNRVVKEHAQDYEAWEFLGLAQIQKQDLKNATKSLETAIKLNSRRATAHVGLSYSLLLRNKTRDARRAAQAALSIDPNSVDAHYLLAVVHLRTGARENALREAEIALKLNPQFASAYLAKSQALVAFVANVPVRMEAINEGWRSRYAEAAAALEKFLELSPNTEEKKSWVEQLESLRFHSRSSDENQGDHRVYMGREVTTLARILSKPEPAYTEDARVNRVVGTVVLRAVLAADSTIKHLIVVQGLPLGLTEASIKAARLIKFVPATVNGRPVSMSVQLEYNFNVY